MADISEGRIALLALRQMITDHEQAFISALQLDSGKPPVEAYASEISIVLDEIQFLLRQGHKVLKPRTVNGLGLWFQSKAVVSREPYGRVLVLSPWNYPFQLALLPVAGALLAGNTCVLKPSELAPATANVLADLVPRYFPTLSGSQGPRLILVTGDAAFAQTLLQEPWDYVFFTGSGQVGRIVSEILAPRLIPHALELGGKNPVVIGPGGVTPALVRRLVWAKFIHCGQTCIAPDDVLVPAQDASKLIELLTAQIKIFYGENPAQSPDYGRIGHVRHFDRLVKMLDSSLVCSGRAGDQTVTAPRIVSGGQYDRTSRYFAPTLLIDLAADAPLAREEIFGPILPIRTYRNEQELRTLLSDRPQPLTVYCLSQDRLFMENLSRAVQTSAFSHNQFIYHAASSHLPFGGLGSSGHGRYHGLASLITFTYEKITYLDRSAAGKYDLDQQYPPYKEDALALYRKFVRRFRR
ncbi:MAG: aldehyde dehydrogenase family protein [Eubacteriales bacterium]|nr:aldehyde dehydrogenase family protein [Eubacteriales bacterium]